MMCELLKLFYLVNKLSLIDDINATESELRSLLTWRCPILQHLHDAMVARWYTVVNGFVSKGVNQLCVGPASQ